MYFFNEMTLGLNINDIAGCLKCADAAQFFFGPGAARRRICGMVMRELLADRCPKIRRMAQGGLKMEVVDLE